MTWLSYTSLQLPYKALHNETDGTRQSPPGSGVKLYKKNEWVRPGVHVFTLSPFWPGRSPHNKATSYYVIFFALIATPMYVPRAPTYVVNSRLAQCTTK